MLFRSNTREGTIDLDLAALGIPSPPGDAPAFAAHDLLSGAVYAWGSRPYVRLDPTACAHVISVRTL